MLMRVWPRAAGFRAQPPFDHSFVDPDLVLGGTIQKRTY